MDMQAGLVICGMGWGLELGLRTMGGSHLEKLGKVRGVGSLGGGKEGGLNM